MDVLLTGPYGRCGTAIIEHLYDNKNYNFSYLDRGTCPEELPNDPEQTYVEDITNREEIEEAFEGQDAVIHLAGYPYVEGTWEDIYAPNIVGLNNILELSSKNNIEKVVFASSNHVMGQYEVENSPDIYYKSDILLDYMDPVRPDSYYGTSKAFGEDLGRQYVETLDYPTHFHAIRICSVRHKEYDHPYGDAERGVEEGNWERDSDEYNEQVARMKAMWQSRRDFAHEIDCCLQSQSTKYGIFSGVSDNDRRWYSIDNARTSIGYRPQDNGEEWDSPPS